MKPKRWTVDRLDDLTTTSPARAGGRAWTDLAELDRLARAEDAATMKNSSTAVRRFHRHAGNHDDELPRQRGVGGRLAGRRSPCPHLQADEAADREY